MLTINKTGLLTMEVIDIYRYFFGFEENFDIGSLKDAIANDIDVSDEIINKSGHPYVFGDRESVEEFWKEEYMHMYKAFWTLMYEYVNPLKHLY